MAGGISITLENDERLIAKLAALAPIARNGALRATRRSVDAVRETAIDGIRSPPKTGRVYTQRFATSIYGGVFAYGSRPPHQASAEGEYPAADTGNLMRSIWAEVDEGLAGLSAEDLDTQLSFSLGDLIDDEASVRGMVGTDADYAAPLEYKPPERGGRPFLRRALIENRDNIHAIFIEELRGKFGGGGAAPPAGPSAPPAPTPPPATPRPPSGPSAEDLNRAELERLLSLPPPLDGGG